MYQLFHYLSYLTVAPVALLYLFLLNDQWRVSAGGKAMLAILSACASLPLPNLLLGEPKFYALFFLAPCLVTLGPLYLASRVRDGRFFFLFFSGFLVAWLTNAVSGTLSYYSGVPLAAILPCMDALLLFLCWKFCRPVFLAVFQVSGKGWLQICILPLVLCAAYLMQADSLEYADLQRFPQVQVFRVCLLLITILLFAVLLSFFKKQSLWYENTVNASLLDAQLEDLSEDRKRQDAAAGQARILRHDLRHYLPILSRQLSGGDRAGARDTVERMRALIRGRQGGDGS